MECLSPCLEASNACPYGLILGIPVPVGSLSVVHPAAVHEQFLTGHGLGGMAGEEEHDAGDLVGLDEVRDALGLADHAFHGGGDELLQLTVGHDPSWGHGVDPDALGSEFSGEGTGESNNASLGGHVGAHGRGPGMKGDGGEVDDGTAFGHVALGSLGGEKVRAEIAGEEVIPLGRRHGGESDPGIPGGIVDEDMDLAVALLDGINPAMDLGFLVQIDAGEPDGFSEFTFQGPPGVGIAIAKMHAGTLGMEGADDGVPDAIGAAGDEYGVSTKIGVGGGDHMGMECGFVVSRPLGSGGSRSAALRR